MKRVIFASLLAAMLPAVSIPMYAAKDSTMLSSRQMPTHIEYNNTVLAKVNGKAITLYDVIKKLDLVFYRQFPEYRDIIEAKYQFYMINWKPVLEDLIDKELIMADAEETSFKVSAGDIRQEMETLFGPNIVANLDSVGLSYDEAWNIVKGDIIIRRMMSGRVNPKAIRAMTPQAVRKAYEKYAQENRNPEIWKYRVISFRDKDPSQAAEAANYAHHLLTVDQINIDTLADMIKKQNHTKNTTVSVSEEFKHTPKEVSAIYLDMLATLDNQTYSQPVAQKSKAAGGTVFRIFYMQEKVPEGADSLDMVETKIKEKIYGDVTTAETEAYLQKLRKHFAVQDFTTKEDFQPFILR